MRSRRIKSNANGSQLNSGLLTASSPAAQTMRVRAYEDLFDGIANRDSQQAFCRGVCSRTFTNTASVAILAMCLRQGHTM